MGEFLTWFAEEIVQHLMFHALWYAASALLIGGGCVLSVLVFGRRYKQRIADMEAEIRRLGGGSVVVGGTTVVVNAGDYSSVIQELRDELKAKDLELLDLKTIVGRLYHKPIPGTSATYVELPEGTRVVTMGDGSIRLALPVRLETHLRIADAVEAELNPSDKS